MVGLAFPMHATPKALLELCKTLNYQKYHSGIQKLEDDPPSLGERYSIKHLINSEVCDGFIKDLRRVEWVKSDSLDPFSFTNRVFLIKLLRHKQRIIYFSVEEVGDKDKLINFWQDKTLELVDSFQLCFKNLYDSRITLGELFDYSVIYGTNCGNQSTPLPMRSRLIEALENDDMPQIKRWLASGSIEKQMYGLEGMLRFKYEGVNLGAKMEQLITTIGKMEGEMNVCFGAGVERRSISAVTDELYARLAIED